MWIRRLNFVMAVSLGVLALAFVYLDRRPVCINSKVVERIDRLGSGGTETAWRCSYNRDVTFSGYLNREMPSLQSRLSSVEDGLWRMEPFTEALRIVIYKPRPWLFSLQGNVLYIGEDMIKVPGMLERGVVKAWLRERETVDWSENLLEETQTDLVLSSLGIALPAGGETRWPAVLLDGKAYCASPWRWAEHYESCLSAPKHWENQSWLPSLRPLLSKAITTAWRDQSLTARLRAFHHLGDWTRAAGSNPVPEFSVRPLAGAIAAVSTLNQLLSKSAAKVSDSAISNTAAAFTRELHQLGFRDADSRIDLDVLLMAGEKLSEEDTLLKSMASFAEHHGGLKIAVKDAGGLWLLPQLQRIPLTELGNIRATRAAIMRCHDFNFDFDYVLSFEVLADQLLVTDACAKDAPAMNSWIAGGVEAFGRAQRDLRFIQFHLPSLAARRASIGGTREVSNLIQRRDIEDPVFVNLGWQRIEWSEAVGAYRPQAYVDAIEWFRVN